uniref:amino acid permease n=1 Tax=uncultured Dysgonomonas sp. TaxID=206096 RepID=UPI002585568A|nr:amino acid permease [uncultured Dysgonomonas sp.]
MKESLFRKKSIAEALSRANSDKDGLKRTLSANNLIALGVGAIIGTGIFVLTGTAAANYAGPALTISFVISAIGCLLAGLCYAEFASMIPVAGSAYAYSYSTLGELIAWFIGWDLILEYLFTAGTVAVGWSGYVISFLNGIGIHIPVSIAESPFGYDVHSGWYLTGSIINFPAMFIISLMAVLLVLGIKQSATLNNVIVFVKVIVILLFIRFGIAYISTDNWVPYIPEQTSFGHFGFSGILRGAGVIFFAYIGFDAVSTAAQEAKNPQKDMPKGILYSLLICTVLYVAVTLVLTGIAHYTELDHPAPIAYAIDKVGSGLQWLSPLVKIGAIAGLSSVVLVMMLGQSRIFYSMSKDGLLPKFFSGVHRKYGTPYKSTFVTGIASAIIAGVLPINILGELVSIGTLMAFVIVCVSIIVLRKISPEVNRPFKTPFVPLVPILGAAICLLQMIFLPWDTWLRLILWMVIGFIIYFSYSIKHSKLAKK